MAENGLSKLETTDSPRSEPRSVEELYPEINKRAFLRKLDRKLLPPLTLLYLLSFLDRSNGV